MAASRRLTTALAAIALGLTLWATQQQAQSPAPAPRRAPVQRFANGRPDSAMVWGPTQYTSGHATNWTYVAGTLDIPSFDASKRYFVRITNGDTATGANRVSQASMTIAGKEFLSSSDITSSISAMNKVIWITQATSTLQFGVRGPVGSFIKARIYETSDPSYDLHTTWGDITVPNGLNLISDNFSKPSNASGPWTVRVENGDGFGGDACTGVKVTLNGVDVIPLGLVSSTNLTVVRQVTLQTNNTVTMRLYGASGYATLHWTASDTTAPTMNVIRPIEGYVTDTATVATTVTLSDQTPPMSVKVSTLPTFNSTNGFTVATPLPTDGRYTIDITATDRAGYAKTLTRHVIRDTQAPQLTVSRPLETPLLTTDSTEVTVGGAWSDTSITTVWVDDKVVGFDSSGVFTTVVPLDFGPNGILFRARDSLGHVTQFKRYVNRVSSESTIPATVNASTVSTQEPTAFRSAIEFLFADDPNALQKGATLVRDSIKADRAAVIRGLAFSRDLGPLPNVKVRVLDHPEFGETKTRADGRFDLAVNGGQVLTLRFNKAGYLETQRRVEPIPLRFSQLDDVSMIGESARYLPVDVASDTMLVGRFENDANGDRRLWVYVPQGAQATITPDGGAPLPPLSTYQIRLKEFTVGSDGADAMPGTLPPTTAYTYCVDMSLKEADDITDADALRPRVTFSKNLSTYVKEFLGMPVGTTVPSGYYEPRTGTWVANEDGCVVAVDTVIAGEAILETDGVPGTDSAERWALLGIDLAERKRMAKVFPIKTVLWRMRVDHFSSHDFNYNQGSDPGSQTAAIGAATSGADLMDDPSETCGCVVENENRVLGESIPVVGTPYALDYRSSRQVDDHTLRWIRIPVTGATVPSDLRNIHIVVDIAGRRFTHEYAGTPFSPIPANETWRFEEWDGTDVYGRPVVGSTVATIRVGYERPTVYAAPSSRGGSWDNSAATGGAITRTTSGDRDRGRIEWRTQTVTVGAPSLEMAGLGHWTITPHHEYDPTGRGTLYRGDGKTLRGKARFPVIKRFAGNGLSSRDTPTLPTGANTSNCALSPTDLAIGRDGSTYISDERGNAGTAIRRVTPDGRVEEVAGAGLGPLVEGPALVLPIGSGANLGLINGIAMERNGGILFATLAGRRVCRVTTGGQIQFVAGNGTQQGPSAPLTEGGLAAQQPLGEPTSVAVGPDGSIFVGDYGAHKIYRIATDGTIRTYAGTGLGDYSTNPPSGAPASSMAVGYPSDIAVDDQGRVFWCDHVSTKLFEIALDGYMRQISPAPDHNPRSLAIGPDGALYVGQYGAYSGVIRREPTGDWSIIAGTIQNNASDHPGPDFARDEGATAAGTQLANLRGLAVLPSGDILTAEQQTIVGPNINFTPSGIRRITQETPGVTASEIYYPNEAGTEISVFTLGGRHLRTVDAHTGVTLHSFTYDGNGRLATISDGSGRPPTTIERSGGVATAIVAPFGQRTELTVGGGYLAKVRNPAADTDSLVYTGTNGSLLAHHRSPEGEVERYFYDGDGRLSRENDAGSGYNQLDLLAGSVTDTSRTVERTTAMTRVTNYQVKELLNGIHRRLIRYPDLSTHYSTDSVIVAMPPDGGRVLVDAGPTGEVTTTRMTRDSRYGMLAPIPSDVTTKLPSGITRTQAMTRTWGGSGVSDQTFTTGNDVFRARYDSLSHILTLTSAMNRVTEVLFDSQGRPTSMSRAGLAPITLTYDGVTKLVSDVTQGGRTWHYGYDAGGRLQLVRDPLMREATFERNAAGRVLSQALPGARTIGYAYDRNGSLLGLTPPGTAEHKFRYTPVGLNDRYTPPAVPGIADPATVYEYNADRQLEKVTRPDGGVVDLVYAGAYGQLTNIVHPRGETSLNYRTTTVQGNGAVGQLESVKSADSVIVTYTHDGPLVTSETWSGRLFGTVAHDYDNAFRESLERVTVGAMTDTAGFAYDGDGLLVRASKLRVTRQTTTGLVQSTSIGTGSGAVASTHSYNSHGELTELDYTRGGAAFFHQHLERDSLGRIVRNDETWSWPTIVTTNRQYEYDPAGRLARVLDGAGTQIRRYVYDGGGIGNGNRTAEYGPGDGLLASGSYDAQDRMTSYGAASYAYTEAGELKLRASPADTLSTEYDALGSTVSAGYKVASSSGPTGPITVGTTYTYQVDGANRRVRKLVNGDQVSGWLYRDWISVAAELDGTGALMHHYLYATLSHSPDLILHGDTAYRVVTDHLGSVRAVVRITDGVVVERRDYDAWGATTYQSSEFQSLGYAAGLTDSDTKLVRFGMRDYQPDVGRWTCKDPGGVLGADDGNNYGYAAQSPVTLIDDTGANAHAPQQLPPAIPPTSNILKDICEARLHRGDIIWFISKVRTGGDWDTKKNGKKQYEAYGNWHFGVVAAAAGLPNIVAEVGAGVYQAYSGTSRPEFINPLPWGFQIPFSLPPYGDDPVDQMWIEYGQAYYAGIEASVQCGCGKK